MVAAPLVLAQFASSEQLIKKSRFISWACPVQNRAALHDYIQQAKNQYPDARHHCYAYILGSGNSVTDSGSHDAGEPAGTAGKPILNVLSHKNIGNIAVIVIRYFGGIKLGAGGLVRAYSSSAQQVLDIAITREWIATTAIQITADFAQEPQLRYLLNDIGSELVIDYHQQLTLSAKVPNDALPALKARLAALQIELVTDD